ncbi:hypothetical protein N5C43_18830 [Comamonas terrigena]|uniref:hypothetical protein n=1 Tax=Comamonas terrigena TaxID=32013 RepID=UPI0024478C41|nr:hypothetical protein [Comamonas terrigena]MDH1293304.1 hypothetical protein [Comamonas terrigena]
MTKSDKSNFERQEVVSPKKSGVRVIRLTLNAGAKARLSSNSSGVKVHNKAESTSRARDDEVEDKHAFAC